MKSLVLLGLVAACSHGGEGPIDGPRLDPGGCSFSLTEVVAEPPPQELEPLVRACEMDAQQCMPLCRKILDQRSNTTDIIDTCTVEHAAAMHTVRIDYHLTCAD